MHPKSWLAAVAFLLSAGCASTAVNGHFHVDPDVGVVQSGPDGSLSPFVHDEAVRSGRALGWTDASDSGSAAVNLSYAWRREAGASSDRFRLVCHWRTSTGEGGEVTDGLAMPAHFWTETRAAEAAFRLCAVTLRMSSAHAPLRAP